MPVQPRPSLFNLFGLVAWGDLGPLTMYRRPDGRLVIFSKTWPDKPPSPAQAAQRTLFSAAATAWRALNASQRAQWAAAAARSSLCMTGYNLFLHWALTGDDLAIRTIQRQTRTTLLP